MRCSVFFCALLFVWGTLYSQGVDDLPHTSPDFESIMENTSDDGTGKSATLDELELYRMNPVNVNTASFQELTGVPFLPFSAATKILLLRDSLGSLALADLRLIPGMDEQTLGLVSPFITFASGKWRAHSPAFSDSITAMSFRSRGSIDIHPQQAFLDGEFVGSRVAQYDRMVINTPRWSGGMLFAKDAGEPWDAGFMSGYIGLENDGFIKKFVAGDYTINTGQGLMLSSSRSSSKGGSVLYQIKATGRTIVPHLATDESHYFQGAAMTMELYPVALTIFLSRKEIAAALDSNGSITSFYTSGLFRSQTELEKRNVATETTIGGSAEFRIGSTQKAGLSVLKTAYDKQIAARSPFILYGKGISAIGANADFVFDSFTLFGELAGNSVSSKCGAAGFIYEVSKRLSLSSQLRSYSKGYSNPYAYGFGEQNGVVNSEIGQYVGMEYYASREIKLSASYDEFALPSSAAFTTTGNECIVRCESPVTKSVKVSVQFKDNRKSEENTLTDTEKNSQKIFEERNQENLRATCSLALNKWTEFVERVEFTSVTYSISHSREEGALMFTEVNISPQRSSFSGTARMVFFDTQSYDSRVYEYESDVRGGYSFPPLYGRGSRWYFVVEWKVIHRMELSLKYSETFHTASVSTAAENSRIIGPLDNRVTLQIDVGL